MGYKDMMRMIGNFKYVPEVIANSAPKQEYKEDIIVGPGAEIQNKIAMDRMRRAEEEAGNPENWTQKDKDNVQKALNRIKQVRQSYPIHDTSHKKDEYKITARPDLENKYYNKYDNGGTLDETDPFWPYQQTNYFNPSLSMGFSPFQFNNLDSGISGSLNYTHPLASYSTPGGQSRFDFGPSFTASGLMGQEEDAYTSTWQGEPYTVDADFWNNRANLGFNAAYQSLIGNRGLVAGGELEGGIGMGTNTIDTPYGFQSTAVGSPYASGQVGLGYYPENSPYNARAILGYGTELAPAHRPGGYFGLYGGMGPLQLGITKDRQGWGGGFDLSFPLGSKNPEVIPDVYQTGGTMPVEGGLGSISSSAFSEAADIKNKAGGEYKGLTPYNMDVSFEHDLITSNVGSFQKGGIMKYDSGGIEDVEDVEGMEGLAGAAVEEQETLSLDESSNLIGDLNPHVSDENYTSFYNQLQRGENGGNKGYNPETKLWYPFSVGIGDEQNIGWGINMSTFSKSEQERMSQGITQEEVEQLYKDRIASHLNKSQEYINTWQGDWTRVDKKSGKTLTGNTGYIGKEGNWDNLPDNVKLVLTDFSYNLGGLEKFPKFVTAIMNNDLEGAQAEYKRYYKDNGKKKELTRRNEDIYDMIFKDAKGDGKIYRKGGSFKIYTKGGLFDNGGIEHDVVGRLGALENFNEKGELIGESTHKMIHQPITEEMMEKRNEEGELIFGEYDIGEWIAFPSLFQDVMAHKDDSTIRWDDWEERNKEKGWYGNYQEALRRGEIYRFDSEEEAEAFAVEGNWKKDKLQKGGIFQNGGITEVDDDEEDFFISQGYLEKGAFPFVNADKAINSNVNKNVYLSLAMARHYGYDGEIKMTSGQRGPEAQWRAMLNNIKTHGKHKLSDYSKSFQKVVNDAAAANGGYDTKETEKVIVDWLNQQIQRHHNGEIDANELGGLTSRHILGEAVDFTGEFKTWLAKGDAGTNKKAAQFIKDFNIHVYNETDHFHVSFKDINTDELSETSEIFKENIKHYKLYDNQFTDLSTSNEAFPDVPIINMNTSSYTGMKYRRLFGPFPETLPITNQDITSIPSESITTLPEYKNPLLGYNEYQEYLNEATKKQQKTIGYQIHENLGMMDRYNPENPILSYNEWLNENPEFQQPDKIEDKEESNGGIVEPEPTPEPEVAEKLPRPYTPWDKDQYNPPGEFNPPPSPHYPNPKWPMPNQPINPGDFGPNPPYPDMPINPDDFTPWNIPEKEFTPGPWERLPGDELSPQANPYERLEEQRIKQNLQTTYEIGNHVNSIKNMINNWKSNK